jgi:Holliday junction resolvase RusA-like endonuclease
VKFTIPIPEKVSLNKIYAGIHFRERSDHKDAYYLAVLAANVPRWTGPLPVAMHYHFRLSGSRLDISNHAYMLKMVEDALVHTRVIPADDQKHVAQITITAERSDRSDVEIEIKPAFF